MSWPVGSNTPARCRPLAKHKWLLNFQKAPRNRPCGAGNPGPSTGMNDSVVGYRIWSNAGQSHFRQPRQQGPHSALPRQLDNGNYCNTAMFNSGFTEFSKAFASPLSPGSEKKLGYETGSCGYSTLCWPPLQLWAPSQLAAPSTSRCSAALLIISLYETTSGRKPFPCSCEAEHGQGPSP